MVQVPAPPHTLPVGHLRLGQPLLGQRLLPGDRFFVERDAVHREARASVPEVLVGGAYVWELGVQAGVKAVSGGQKEVCLVVLLIGIVEALGLDDGRIQVGEEHAVVLRAVRVG